MSKGLLSSPLVIPILLVTGSVYFLWSKLRSISHSKSVTLIVLGDIGRSPRMVFHATSLAANGYSTHIVAYRGSTPPKVLLESPHVHFVDLSTPMPWLSNVSRPVFILLSPLKVLVMTFNLLWALLRTPTTSFMITQNPPAIPTLPVVKVAAFLKGSKVIIDWHNTGWSVLALRVGENSMAVKIAKWIETVWGQKAYAHLCVTEAMRKNLIRDAALIGKTVVFHDRPPSNFRKQTVQEAHDLFSRLPVFSSQSITNFFEDSSNFDPLATIFTTSPNPTTLIHSRPALVVSSTSWTADEDFSILLAALELYEIEATRGVKLPKVIVVITGKGALKQAFEKEVATREDHWKWVRVRTAWLEVDDYPKLLGSADLGISLHASTSGADLPMKVVDMFGCSLPVCALDFACVDELIKDEINGRTFKTSQELCDQLVSLLADFTASTSKLDSLRQGILSARYGEEKEQWSSWEENWNRIVEPLLRS